MWKVFFRFIIMFETIFYCHGHKNCFFNIRPEVEKANYIDNSGIDSKDCVLLFHPIHGKKLTIKFRHFQPITEEVDSCVSSYTKIFKVDSVGNRMKLAHFCNALPSDERIVFDTGDRVELVIIQAQIDLVFEYTTEEEEGDMNRSEDSPTMIVFEDQISTVPRCKYPEDKDCTNLDKSMFRTVNETGILTTMSSNILTPFSTGSKADCQRWMQLICKSSRFCGDSVDERSILCNKTMYLCVDPAHSCDGIRDCIIGDDSDEFRCFFPYLSNSLFGVVGLFVCCLTSICFINHKTSLRKNNMVRFNGDVLKRKDVIKAKKNNIVERDLPNDVITDKTKSIISMVEKKTPLVLDRPSCLKSSQPLPTTSLLTSTSTTTPTTTTTTTEQTTSGTKTMTMPSNKPNNHNSILINRNCNVKSAENEEIDTNGSILNAARSTDSVLLSSFPYDEEEVEDDDDDEDEVKSRSYSLGYGYRFEYRDSA